MAAMGAESTPIVAARATIRNMDRIAWMKRVASRCARATVARTRARPLHSQNVLVSQSTAPCNSRSSRRARGRCIGRGSSRGPSELVSAEVLKMVSAPNFAVNSRFFPNRAEFRPAPAVYYGQGTSAPKDSAIRNFHFFHTASLAIQNEHTPLERLTAHREK